MFFRQTEIQLSSNGMCGLLFSSFLSTHLARFPSPTIIIGCVNPTTLFLSDVTSHACDCLLWQGGRYVLPLQHHRYHCGSREVLAGQDASHLGSEAADHEVAAR
jgi:hypothetical protein